MGRRSGRSHDAVLLVLGIFFLGFGLFGLKYELLDLPHRYDLLASRGIADADAFAGCSYGRDTVCRLRTGTTGKPRTYGVFKRQFRGMARGTLVPVLVDPDDASVRATAVDVARRSEAGFGAVSVLHIAAIIAGLSMLAPVSLAVWPPHRHRRTLRDPAERERAVNERAQARLARATEREPGR